MYGSEEEREGENWHNIIFFSIATIVAWACYLVATGYLTAGRLPTQACAWGRGGCSFAYGTEEEKLIEKLSKCKGALMSPFNGNRIFKT